MVSTKLFPPCYVYDTERESKALWFIKMYCYKILPFCEELWSSRIKREMNRITYIKKNWKNSSAQASVLISIYAFLYHVMLKDLVFFSPVVSYIRFSISQQWYIQGCHTTAYPNDCLKRFNDVEEVNPLASRRPSSYRHSPFHYCGSRF